VIRWPVVGACLALSTAVHAEKLALREVHGEPDVADEAKAVDFLVRASLAKDERTLIAGVPVDMTVGTAKAAIAQLHADHAAMVEVGRDGTGLRATVALVDPDGGLVVRHLTVGDGDVAKLAQGTVDIVVGTTHALATPVPGISMGRLRPYTIAVRTGDPASLVDAIPATALAVPSIIPAIAKLPNSTLTARSIASRAGLDAMPQDDTAAHVFAAIDRAEVTAAEGLLGKPPKKKPESEPGLMILARALLADLRNDTPAVQRFLADGLASDQPRAIIAFASSLQSNRFSSQLLEQLVAALATVQPTPGVVSRIGLLAAEHQVAGGLDLISCRELDESELQRLIPLIEIEPDPTIRRLRAEVSMRRADGHQAEAIQAYLTAAPNDVRAHLAHGLALMATANKMAAAGEFDAAGNQRLRGRALFQAKEIVEAVKTFDNHPVSAEELAIAALNAKKLDEVVALAAKADALAPANPLVQRVVATLADKQGDVARAKLAQPIADDGKAPAFTLVADGSVAVPTVAPSPAAPAGKPAPAVAAPAAAAGDDDGGGLPIIPLAIAVAALIAGVAILVVVRRRGRIPAPSQPATTTPEESPLQQLVIESPPPPEPDVEPFADFPFPETPIPPPAPPPHEELGELSLAPEVDELVLADSVPQEPIAVSFHRASQPVIPGGIVPTPPVGVPIDLFEEHPDSMPGMVLDRYRCTRELGRGAMGVVYRAWDTNLEREVAIKVMAEELRQNAEAMALFTQEAKSLAALNHANIVHIYDQVTVADKVYMIMELVDGTTLEHTLLDKKIYPWREALVLIDQLLQGLAYAHARRVIHRDIKPANIFLTTDGGVKLGDFGLARVMRELQFRATEVRGTPLYMAPEQITGTDIDHRTDLYAVGCTLYELVTGRPPFVDGDILYQQVHTNPIPISILVAGVPQLLERLIMNMLNKQLDARPKSANEVRSVLKNVS